MIAQAQDPTARHAALVLAFAGAGAQLAASAADAWFLASFGPRFLGGVIAASSLLVAVTLALVGALSDQRDRRRTLIVLAASGAVILPALDLAHRLGARTSAVVAMIVVKQLQAAVDLGFWVAIAERFDARSARRVVPWLTAAGGLGATAGAALVIPIAEAGGASAALLAGAAMMAAAAALATRLPAARRFGSAPAPGSSLRWGGGWEQLQRQPLARGLAVVVALGGAFASLAYFVLGAGAAARYPDAGALAQFLGGVRALSQAVMLVAQVAIAPRLLARAGIGGALLIAPIGAAVAAVLVAITGGLGAAALVQVQARVLDGALEAPAEKLAQNLLPAEIRGRVGGFLDGVAKRAGAVTGGVGATALVAWPRVFAAVLGAVAVAWVVAALVLRARLPGWALTALGSPTPRRTGDADVEEDDVILGPAAARRIAAELDRHEPVLAAGVAARMHQAGAIDARPLIASLLPRTPPDEQAQVAAALWSCARVPVAAAATESLTGMTAMASVTGMVSMTGVTRPMRSEREGLSALRAAAAALPGLTDDAAEWVARTAGVIARGRRVELAGDRAGAAGAALMIARARADGEAPAIDVAIDLALDDDDPAVQAAGVRDLAVEVEALAAAPDGRGFELGRKLLRITRRGRPGEDGDLAHAVAAIGALARGARGLHDAEAVLFRTEAYELVRRLADRHVDPAAPATAAAALTALAAWSATCPPEDVHLLADALGDRDDDVRDAAAAALRRLGASAAPDLARAAGFGRRAARDRALALLRELPVTTRTLDRLVDAELDALDRGALHAAALADLRDPWVTRRLGERLDEIGHTTLLLVAARERSTAIAAGARLLRHAHGKDERARALEALDAALPRALALRLLPALDAGELAARVRGAVVRSGGPPGRDAVIKAELTGGDPLLRPLLVRALGADRARYRTAIADAARAAAAEVSPLDLLRRITAPAEDGQDVPAAVEKMLLLAGLPLLAEATTPQIGALAERAEVLDLAADDILCADGERLDALVVVAEGALVMGDRRITAGQAVDELAPMAPRPVPAAVVADGAARLVRVARVDFEELVDDEPGLAAALLRLLGERLRASDRSP